MKEENRKTEEGMEEEVGKGSTGAEDDNYELEAQTNNGKNSESEDSPDSDQAQIIISGEDMKVAYTKVKQQKNSAEAQECENMENTVNSKNRGKPQDGDEKRIADVEADLRSDEEEDEENENWPLRQETIRTLTYFIVSIPLIVSLSAAIIIAVKLPAVFVHGPEMKKLSLKASLTESSNESAIQLIFVGLISICAKGTSATGLLSMASSLLMVGKAAAESYLTFGKKDELKEASLLKHITLLATFSPIFILTAVFIIGSFVVITAWLWTLGLNVEPVLPGVVFAFLVPDLIFVIFFSTQI